MLFLSLPALLGDDHLRLVPVELQPKLPIAEVDLGPGPGAAAWQRHVAESGPRAGVRVINAARTLAELIGRPEVTAPAGGRREPRWRQHGAQVERRGVPGGVRRAVHGPAGGVGDERAGVRCLGALLRGRGRDVVALGAHPLLCVPVAWLLCIRGRRLAPRVRRLFCGV